MDDDNFQQIIKIITDRRFVKTYKSTWFWTNLYDYNDINKFKNVIENRSDFMIEYNLDRAINHQASKKYKHHQIATSNNEYYSIFNDSSKIIIVSNLQEPVFIPTIELYESEGWINLGYPLLEENITFMKIIKKM